MNHWLDLFTVKTLIHGETLLDLLIRHEIGGKKKTVAYHELDESAFLGTEPEEADD